MEEEDENPPRFAPRLSNIAVRRLGYTRTEAGFRRAGQIMDELGRTRIRRRCGKWQTPGAG